MMERGEMKEERNALKGHQNIKSSWWKKCTPQMPSRMLVQTILLVNTTTIITISNYYMKYLFLVSLNISGCQGSGREFSERVEESIIIR
jgi:hypothetical protein